MENYDFSGKTILIAEDEETNFMFLKALLRKTNVEIVWARTGLLAIEEVKAHPDIRLILMDMRMPDMGGLETSAIIKKMRPDMKIIAQTAYALAGEKEKILDAGCDNYVSKPIVGKMLLQMIDEYLK